MMKVSLVEPFPKADCRLLWDWLLEFPDFNFDDYGPKNFQEFEAEMGRRIDAELTWQARVDEVPAGFIGYCPITARHGCLHGISFAKSTHGTGVPLQAMNLALGALWKSGVEKVIASYSAQNHRVRAFLMKVGAVDEGYLRAATLRMDEPSDLRLVAIFNPSCKFHSKEPLTARS